jgi:hypothetical protein
MVAQWILVHPLALGTDPCEEANLMVHCSFATSWFSLFCVMQQVVVGNCHKCRNYVMMIRVFDWVTWSRLSR